MPAKLVRRLGIQDLEFAIVKVRFNGQEHELKVRLLRTKYTDSRQFTIPKDVREKYKLRAGAVVEVTDIQPLEGQK